MAEFYTDFSEYESGPGSPVDWVRRGSEVGVTYAIVESEVAVGGKHLRREGGGSNANRSLTWSAVGAATDVEVLTRCKTVQAVSGLPAMAAVRFSDDGMDGYAGGFGIVGTSTRSIRLDRITSTGNSVLASIPYSWENGVWYWVRMRAVESMLSVKVWSGRASAEPAAWHITAVDSDLVSGRVGCFARRPDTHDWDIFSTGTDGDPAPSPPTDAAKKRRILSYHYRQSCS